MDIINLDTLLGMTQATAEGYLTARGYYMCVNMKDGEEYAHTLQFDPSRIHVEVENNHIVKVNGAG